MATTWAGTADNQLVTFQALKNAVDTGILSGNNTITSSSEIVTKADVEYYIYMGTYNSTWSGYSSTRCPTKSIILQSALFDWSIYASTAGTNYTIYHELKRAGSVISSGNQNVTSTTCTLKVSAVSNARYNDQLYVYGMYGGSIISTYSNLGANNCLSSGTQSCGHTYTFTTGGIYVSHKPVNLNPCV
jgi:hypothetical protein